MKVITTWSETSQYPQFDLELASKDGADPFLKIRGCKLMNGKNGEFVSYPSKKLDSGKYWNHVYGSDAFNAAVLAEAKKTQPAAQVPQKAKEAATGGFDDSAYDIPFN